MLNRQETLDTAKELLENYNRLGYLSEKVASDLHLNEKQVKDVLTMNHSNLGHVWMMRDYLEEMLIKEGKEVYPFSRLADHSANKWFSYEKTWKK